MTSLRFHSLAVMVVTVGCTDAWAQPPRDGDRHRHRDAGVGVDVTGVDASQRPATHGTLDPTVVQRVLRMHGQQVRRCYETGLAHDAGLHGQVVVHLRVEADGRVSETSSGGDTALRDVGLCIEDVFSRVMFPPPMGGAATVAAPFVFAAGE